MEDLTKQWNCLSLSEREGEDLCIKKDHQSKERIIAAFFLTQRALNMEAMLEPLSCCGGRRMALRSREKGIIRSFSFLTTRRMWIEFFQLSHGASISRWWLLRDLTRTHRLKNSISTRLLFGSKSTTFLSGIGIDL